MLRGCRESAMAAMPKIPLFLPSVIAAEEVNEVGRHYIAISDGGGDGN